MLPTPKDAAALQRLMKAPGDTETKCQPFLRFATSLLQPTPFATNAGAVREQINRAGRSDYFVICDVISGGRTVRKAWVWECKSPQASLFEYDTNARLKPTRELVSAENQLLWYWDCYRGDAAWRSMWQITHEDHVQIGGIIIGRDCNRYKNHHRKPIAHDVFEGLGETATRIRETKFHAPAQIVVHSWDRIYDKILRDSAGAQASDQNQFNGA